MNIGVFQFDIEWENKRANQEKIRGLMRSVIEESAAEWIIFPEMTLTGFSMNSDLTEHSDYDVLFFRELARKYNFFVTFGGVLNGSNCSITLDQSGMIINEYSKMHLFSYAGEDKYYTSGGRQSSFNINGIRIKPMVCYDLRFSYLFWDKAPEIDAYLVIANWPASRIVHWRTLLQARAIENQAYVIGVNRIGNDTKNAYCGNSLVIDPMGNIILDCGDKEGLFTVDINGQTVIETRKNYPFLRDRKKLL